MGKQKIELTKRLSITGFFNAEDMTIDVNDEVVSLAEKLKMFDTDEVSISIAVKNEQ